MQLVDKWQLHEHKLVKFLMRIEDGYPNNPYHNRVHAADVLQSLHVLVIRGGLIQSGYCDEIGLTSCYLSAVSLEPGLVHWTAKTQLHSSHIHTHPRCCMSHEHCHCRFGFTLHNA